MAPARESSYVISSMGSGGCIVIQLEQWKFWCNLICCKTVWKLVTVAYGCHSIWMGAETTGDLTEVSTVLEDLWPALATALEIFTAQHARNLRRLHALQGAVQNNTSNLVTLWAFNQISALSMKSSFIIIHFFSAWILTFLMCAACLRGKIYNDDSMWPKPTGSTWTRLAKTGRWKIGYKPLAYKACTWFWCVWGCF